MGKVVWKVGTWDGVMRGGGGGGFGCGLLYRSAGAGGGIDRCAMGRLCFVCFFFFFFSPIPTPLQKKLRVLSLSRISHGGIALKEDAK